MAYTFSLFVGGDCGLDQRSRIQSFQVLPLVSCRKNILCMPQEFAEVQAGEI